MGRKNMSVVISIFCVITISLLIGGFAYQHEFNKKYKTIKNNYSNSIFFKRTLAINREENTNIKYD